MSVTLTASAEAVVLVEYGLFHLYDDAYLQDEQLPLPTPVSAGTGWIAISAGATDERVQVRLEVWDGAPTAPEDTELQVEVTFTATSGHVQLWSVAMGPASPGADSLVLGPTGQYTVRVSSWGRERAARMYAEDPVALITGDHVVERYLLQFWL